MKKLILFLLLGASLLVGSTVRIPGPGGKPGTITPPPVADITVSAFTRAAIVTALSQCTGNAGGTTIFFPAGTYNITSPITIPHPACQLFGIRSQSILDSTSCGICYVFVGNTFDDLAGGAIYNLKFVGGGINFVSMNGGPTGLTSIHHNVFQNVRTGLVLGFLGGLSNTTINNNIVYGNPCPAPCGSTNPQFVKVDYTVENTTITGNWVENMWEAISMGGNGTAPRSHDVSITSNTLLGMVRMGIEFVYIGADASINNNYIAQWRTQNETNFPTGVSSGSYQGQNPVPGCVNYPNGTGNNTQGGGNRYDCDSFGISTIGAPGDRLQVNGNKIYGLPSGPRGPVWGIEFVASSSGELRNNVNQGMVWNIWDDGFTAARANYSGNIACGEQDTNPGTGGGNIYRSSCSDPAIPAVQPVPNQPFDPVTGN